MSARLAGSVFVATLLSAASAHAAASFSYEPPGKLLPKSGTGRVDATAFVPDMRFPIESGPAFANSQVYNPGGGEVAGDQCDADNFTYPWRDNYCEKRSWSMPLCPSGAGHQGQDIRAGSCVKDKHWVVAVADGTITSIGSYSVYLTAPDGTRFDYLHMSNVQVQVGQKVVRGQRVGKVSNVFGGTPTTVHLHFNIKQNVQGLGSVYVPPYMSLVRSYERLLGLGVPDASAPGADAAASSVPEPAAEGARPPAETTSATIEPASDADGQAEDDAEPASGGCQTARGASPGGLTLLGLAALLGLGSRAHRKLRAKRASERRTFV